jgi:hypothetical protein
MIWFACKNCGKRHKQPDEAAGSLVFCDCGQSNRVPWPGAVPEPRQGRRRDPAACLNHAGSPSAHTCPDCGEAFCPRCLVEFQRLRLCGPCKNFRVRRLQRPPRAAGLAVGALVAGLVCAPVVFCGTLMAVGAREPRGILVGGAVGMVLGAAAVVLGVAGLRQAEGATGRGGQGMALTGTALGGAALLWSLSLVVIMAGRLVEG